jgi:hypothetical protein
VAAKRRGSVELLSPAGSMLRHAWHAVRSSLRPQSLGQQASLVPHCTGRLASSEGRAQAPSLASLLAVPAARHHALACCRPQGRQATALAASSACAALRRQGLQRSQQRLYQSLPPWQSSGSQLCARAASNTAAPCSAHRSPHAVVQPPRRCVQAVGGCAVCQRSLTRCSSGAQVTERRRARAEAD